MLKYKASMQSQSQLPKVSTRFGLVWIESHLGSDSFFSKKNVSDRHQKSRHHLHH